MDIRKPISLVASIALVLGLLNACGGEGGGSGSTSGGETTTVSAYLTDDLGGYQSVEFTLDSVQLRHTGENRNCEIISGPLPLDAAALGRDQLLDLVSAGQCPAGPYNRLHVAFDDDVTLHDGQNTHYCKFVSYLDDSGWPNRLHCADGLCALDLTGAVNLVAGAHEHIALDADLRQFTVDLARTPCEVTLKLSPLHASGMDGKMAAGYRTALNGVISGLDTTARTFLLTHASRRYAVQYAGVTDQTGLDTLLVRAQTDLLRARVRCQSFDTRTTPATCIAQTSGTQPLKAITVMAEGAISSLDTPTVHTFTLGYPVNKSLAVNDHEAFLRDAIEGVLANGATVETALYGFATDFFLAREVEVR